MSKRKKTAGEEAPEKAPTQKQIVLNYLTEKEGNCVSQWQALCPSEYGGFDWFISDLAGRIRDLRGENYDIETIDMISRKGTRYGAYRLTAAWWKRHREEEARKASGQLSLF